MGIRKVRKPSMTVEEYKRKMLECLSISGQKNITNLALVLNIPRRTLNQWFSGTKPKNMFFRELLSENFPTVFEDFDWEEPFNSDNSKDIEEAQAHEYVDIKSSVNFEKPNEQVFDSLEFILSKEKIVVLISYFEKLVYSSTQEEREYFRKKLGVKVWERFLNLTRALVGEKAREMTFEEGRLERE